MTLREQAAANVFLYYMEKFGDREIAARQAFLAADALVKEGQK